MELRFSRFRGLGFRGFGFGVSVIWGFRVDCVMLWGSGLGGAMIWGFRVRSLGFRVWGLVGFRV